MQIKWTNKDISVGAILFPDRKKPSLIIQKNNVCEEYGFFKNEKLAKNFLEQLAELVGAKKN